MINGNQNFLNKLGIASFGSQAGIPQPGLYHYLRDAPGERSRIHLRLDPDGSGLLLVNASRVVHLNPTAARMAYLFACMVSSSILGAIFTFAPGIAFPFYGDAALAFGLAPLTDQQLAGLIMWVPGSGIFFVAILVVFPHG